MANEVLLKSRAEITAQDNSSSLNPSYDPNSASYTGGTPAVLDNRISAASGQPQGADSLNLILLVTTGPATAATAAEATAFPRLSGSEIPGAPMGRTEGCRYRTGSSQPQPAVGCSREAVSRCKSRSSFCRR